MNRHTHSRLAPASNRRGYLTASPLASSSRAARARRRSRLARPEAGQNHTEGRRSRVLSLASLWIGLLSLIAAIWILVDSPQALLTGDSRRAGVRTPGNGVDVATLLTSALPSVVSVDVEASTFGAGRAEYWGLSSVGRGTAFAIDDRGHLVTNYHVVPQDDIVELTLSDGTKVMGEVIGRDPAGDLAVIRARDLAGRVPPLRFAASGTLRPGDTVVAIGDPYGFQRTSTIGIVSALGRTLPGPDGSLMTDIVQVDAAIAPGSSGGPLLNSRGEVVGVVVATVGSVATYGFAIPGDRVSRLVPEMISTGRVSYAWLGASAIRMTAGGGRTGAQGPVEGVPIDRVATGGPAQLVGVRGPQSFRVVIDADGSQSVIPEGGDTVVAVDGRAATSPDVIVRHIRDERRPGEAVRLDLLRNGAFWSCEVVLGVRPSAGSEVNQAEERLEGVPDDW